MKGLKIPSKSNDTSNLHFIHVRKSYRNHKKTTTTRHNKQKPEI